MIFELKLLRRTFVGVSCIKKSESLVSLGSATPTDMRLSLYTAGQIKLAVPRQGVKLLNQGDGLSSGLATRPEPGCIHTDTSTMHGQRVHSFRGRGGLALPDRHASPFLNIAL